MILHVDDARGAFDHLCAPGCGLVRRGLKLDPAAGDLTPSLAGAGGWIAVRACPICHTQEYLNPNLLAWDAQEVDPATGRIATHPGSLTGTRIPHPEQPAHVVAVVTAHHHGYEPEPQHVEQSRLIRQMQRHPQLAPHAPLVELHAARYAQATAHHQQALAYAQRAADELAEW